MGAQDCSRMESMRAATKLGQHERLRVLSEYRYHLLGLAYLLTTGFAFFRIRRQPYPQSLKAGQYETLFKGTTLGAVLTGLVISGKGNRSRSATNHSHTEQRDTDQS